MPSPYSSAAPNRPIMTRTGCTIFPPFDRTSATRARMPPSPWLSARITNSRYFTDTVMISDQKISDNDAEDVGRRDVNRMRAEKAFAQRVQDARADVAVHDTERGEDEERYARFGLLRSTGGQEVRLTIRSESGCGTGDTRYCRRFRRPATRCWPARRTAGSVLSALSARTPIHGR